MTVSLLLQHLNTLTLIIAVVCTLSNIVTIHLFQTYQNQSGRNWAASVTYHSPTLFIAVCLNVWNKKTTPMHWRVIAIQQREHGVSMFVLKWQLHKYVCLTRTLSSCPGFLLETHNRGLVETWVTSRASVLHQMKLFICIQWRSGSVTFTNRLYHASE